MNLRALLALVPALLLSACGGGGVPPSGNDLVVSGSGPTAPVAAGQSTSFTLTVKNSGPVEAKDVVLTASARGLVQTQLAYTCAAAGGAACPSALGASMFASSLPVNGSLTFTVTGPVGDNVDGTISATLRAEAAGDNDRSNNVATINGTAFTLQSNVVVTGIGPSAPVAGGGIATFTMVVTNQGPQPTGDVLIENRPGAGSSLNNITCAGGGGAVCPTSLNPIMLATGIPMGGTLTFTVQNNVAKGYNGTLNNTMQATVAKDPDKTNNIFSATGIADSANLSGSNIAVTGTGPASPVAAGGVATFVMTVSNPGPQASKTVNLVNSVGAGAILTGISCDASGGAACPSAVGPSMQLSTMPVGGVLNFTVSANVAAGAGSGTIKNTMSAILSDDPDKTNNLFTATAATFAADLQVKASPPSTTVKAGSVASFTMTVTNLGPDAAQDVAITNTVDDNLTLSRISCSATGGAVCPPDLGAAMSAALIPANGTLVFTVEDTITAGVVGRVSNTMTVSAAGDAKPGNNTATAAAQSTSVNLGVSQTVAERVAAGKTAFFTATVANAGPSLATNIVLVHTLPSGYTAGTISCTASALAACPDTTGPQMTVASLPVGAKLAFTIPVAIPSNARGPIDALWTATADGDSDTSNNTAQATVIAEDPRNGGYKVFATNGRQYGLTIDFDAGSYSIAGHGSTLTGNFSADTTGGGFTISGNQRFRVAEDLVTGGFDFGDGVKPFVAARRFASAVSELAGAFNVASLTVPVDSTPSSRVMASQFGTSGYQLCTDSTQIFSVASCPAASLFTYVLSVENGIFTGVDATHGDMLSFYVAKSGNNLIYLSAGDAGGASSGTFRIALPDTPNGFAGGNSFGASNLGSWDAVTLSPQTYAVSGTNASGAAFSDTISLGVLASGPLGLRTGLRSGDQARIYVMQSSGLTVLAGARNGAANGLIEISAP
ncbi:hypothetical protein [Aquabacterium sp.]|uniref:hypothetical protein n=1 Tax=Aquabacterium sp. TaxID=1872578 RepID=UPI0037839613